MVVNLTRVAWHRRRNWTYGSWKEWPDRRAHRRGPWSDSPVAVQTTTTTTTPPSRHEKAPGNADQTHHVHIPYRARPCGRPWKHPSDCGRLGRRLARSHTTKRCPGTGIGYTVPSLPGSAPKDGPRLARTEYTRRRYPMPSPLKVEKMAWPCSLVLEEDAMGQIIRFEFRCKCSASTDTHEYNTHTTFL